MASGQTEEPGGSGMGREALIARREQRQRQIRRRRLIASGAIMGAIVAVVGIVAIAGGGSGSGHAKPARTAAASGKPTAAQPKPSGLVRNATPQPDWESHTGPVPILEYHVLGAAPADAPYPELYVSRPDFRRQMDWLDRNGYQAVTLEQVEAAWYHG